MGGLGTVAIICILALASMVGVVGCFDSLISDSCNARFVRSRGLRAIAARRRLARWPDRRCRTRCRT
jgi:hypothetical protein